MQLKGRYLCKHAKRTQITLKYSGINVGGVFNETKAKYGRTM